MPTVGIVTFTANLMEITRAHVEFGLASGGPTMTAPVVLAPPDHRTLLLGMKGSSAYVLRVIATAGAVTCTSGDLTLVTGAVPSGVRKPTATIMNPVAHARGFIITSYYASPYVFILDTDGDVVWWSRQFTSLSRAHMSWDGAHMYMIQANAGNGGGRVARIAMDGTNAESNLAGLDAAHHDLTAIPGGIATLVWNGPGQEVPNSIVERSDDGTLTTVVADLGTVYLSSTAGGSSAFHPNSIHYHAWDDSYTIGDRVPSLYVKITRTGDLVWQLGGRESRDPSKTFQGLERWQFNHGHHLLADGTFLFFNNYPQNVVRVIELDSVSMTARNGLAYQPAGFSGAVLGDVQRLPNGNILVTYCEGRQIHEITSSGELVAVFTSSFDLGYSEFRDSLYGPPQY